MKRIVYPFSAIVEQDAIKTALLLNAVDPTLGGVLIRGHKGTGKSTAARALARLLPDIQVIEGCPFNSDPHAPVAGWGDDTQRAAKPARTVMRPMPFVELPLNATEDRLVGTLHIEKTLQTGQRQFEPGLLATANRGVLYVDEVNLLDDHLVDMLLDAAASGINIVEREGVSFTHPARFILIGTMNPEEGELRPQFLDRFGLCAPVGRITNLESRQTIVQRHLAFEKHPDAFLREWHELERAIAKQILIARRLLENVRVPDALVAFAVKLTHSLQVQGHRADITILKAARAHAALLEKNETDQGDLTQAAQLALSHRIAASPLDSAEKLQEKITLAIRELLGEATEIAPPPDAKPAEDLDEMAERMQVPGSAAAGSIVLSFIKKKTVRPSTKPTVSSVSPTSASKT